MVLAPKLIFIGSFGALSHMSEFVKKNKLEYKYQGAKRDFLVGLESTRVRAL